MRGTGDEGSEKAPRPDDSPVPADRKAERRRKRRRRARTAAKMLVVLFVLLCGARLALPSVVRSYVVRTLDRSPLYDARIGDVHLHLWRGAYTIEDVRVAKTTGNVPVPFFSAAKLDFSIEW